MRFGDALCAAMHDGKWIALKVGVAPDEELHAFRFDATSGLWQSAFRFGCVAPWRHHTVPLKTIPCRMSAEAIAAEWEIVEVPE